MFDRMLEIAVNKDYEERIRKTEKDNLATRVARLNATRTPVLARMGDILIHLGLHLQRRPHSKLNGVLISR